MKLKIKRHLFITKIAFFFALVALVGGEVTHIGMNCLAGELKRTGEQCCDNNPQCCDSSPELPKAPLSSLCCCKQYQPATLPLVEAKVMPKTIVLYSLKTSELSLSCFSFYNSYRLNATSMRPHLESSSNLKTVVLIL